MNRISDKKFNKQKYGQTIRRYSSSPFKLQPYGHALNSLGHFAHMMHMRPTTLIATFAKAGIIGLTPSHIIEESEWKALINFFKAFSKH